MSLRSHRWARTCLKSTHHAIGPTRTPAHLLLRSGIAKALFSTSSAVASDSPTSTTPPSSQPPVRDPRWLSQMKARVGKLIFHGMNETEVKEASVILDDLAVNWREYIAGSEGYLTCKERRGLYRHSVVWGDMDSMGHVNNVMYVRWAESARVLWTHNFAKYTDPARAEGWRSLVTPKGLGMILRSIKVDYKFPMEWPDKVSVFHKLNHVGEDFFTLGVIMLSEKHQRPAARCLEDIVIYDYIAGRKQPIPDWIRTQFDLTLRLQREAAADAGERMNVIENVIERLESSVYGRAEMK